MSIIFWKTRLELLYRTFWISTLTRPAFRRRFWLILPMNHHSYICQIICCALTWTCFVSACLLHGIMMKSLLLPVTSTVKRVQGVYTTIPAMNGNAHRLAIFSDISLTWSSYLFWCCWWNGRRGIVNGVILGSASYFTRSLPHVGVPFSTCSCFLVVRGRGGFNYSSMEGNTGFYYVRSGAKSIALWRRALDDVPK